MTNDSPFADEKSQKAILGFIAHDLQPTLEKIRKLSIDLSEVSSIKNPIKYVRRQFYFRNETKALSRRLSSLNNLWESPEDFLFETTRKGAGSDVNAFRYADYMRYTKMVKASFAEGFRDMDTIKRTIVERQNAFYIKLSVVVSLVGIVVTLVR